jgi:hypothetical protein
MVVEQLLAAGYVLLVVDPEGDHVSIGGLRGVTVLAGRDLPDPADLATRFGPGTRGLVLDLSQLDLGDRQHYLDRLWPTVSAHRADTGLPHWVVLDEAQNVRWCRRPGTSIDPATDWGLCLVSYQPQQLAADLLARMEWRVDLSPGGRTAVLTPPDRPPYPFTLGQRATRHVRHWHKYLDTPLPPQLRFIFRDDSTTPGPVAGNLLEFVDALHHVPAAVITHHCRNGDFSRWLGTVYSDHAAAALVATTERDLLVHTDAERARHLLTELITFQYLPPDPPPQPGTPSPT